MSDVLVRIKRAVFAGRYIFSDKATTELEEDGLIELNVVEAIANAVAVYKKIRSRRPRRGRPGEMLYVIYGTNLAGMLIYTKGKLTRKHGIDTYYLLVSSKRGRLGH